MKFGSTKITLGLMAISSALSLAACSSPASETTEAPTAPAKESAANIVAKLKTTMTPLAYSERVVTCNYNLVAAQRAPEGAFDAELTEQVASFERLDLSKMMQAIRDQGGDSTTFNTAQRAGITLPQRLEDVTPEYIAQTKNCLPILEVEHALQKEAA